MSSSCAFFGGGKSVGHGESESIPVGPRELKLFLLGSDIWARLENLLGPENLGLFLLGPENLNIFLLGPANLKLSNLLGPQILRFSQFSWAQ